MSLSQENHAIPKDSEPKHSGFERPTLKDLTNSNKRHIEDEPEETSMKRRKLLGILPFNPLSYLPKMTRLQVCMII